MKAKLIKRFNGVRWDLYLEEDIDMLNTIASSEDNPTGKLSLKNCQAIANGYDLDELASERLLTRVDENSGYHKFGALAYKEGFQKALEILGDKKFSEEDVRKAIYIAWDDDNLASTHIIESLQQTEWDVEIVMEINLNGKNGLDRAKMIPKLDADGNLILKRK